MKTLITRIKRLALALCFVTPLVSWAATYSTYKDDATTFRTGAFGNANYQRFKINADWMFNTDDNDIAATADAVKLDSIKVYWHSAGHSNADIGKGSNEVDPYLVVTTPQGVIVGISAAGEKWTASGSSTFEFTDLVISPNAQYYYYFATDVSSLTVGGAMSGAKQARFTGAWHGANSGSVTSDTTVCVMDDGRYSIRCDFEVSAATATTITTTSEGVSLSTGSDPVVVKGAVADGVVTVASGANVPALTVVGEATTLKLTDSLTATYLYLPATTTIDASDVTFTMPGSDETEATTTLVSGKISAASNPSVTLPTPAEGYAFESPAYTDAGIAVTITKFANASLDIGSSTVNWSDVKPEGWVNSPVPTITVAYTDGGKIVFDENVQAASIAPDGTGSLVLERGADVTVSIAAVAIDANAAAMDITFKNFTAIPTYSPYYTAGSDIVRADGTETLTSHPLIQTDNAAGNFYFTQPVTMDAFTLFGNKTVYFNAGTTGSFGRFVLGNTGNKTQTVTQNDGTITVTGNAAPSSNQASILLGHYSGNVTLNTVGGTFNALNAATRLGWDGTATWAIGGGTSAAEANVLGIVNGENSHTGRGTLNILANGTLNLGASGIAFSNSSNGGAINFAGGTIKATADTTISNSKAAGTILNQNKTTKLDTDEYTVTLSAPLSGSGVLDKRGSGTLKVTGAGTSTSRHEINGGTLLLSGNGATLGTGGFNMKGSGAHLDIEPGEGNTITLAAEYLINSTSGNSSPVININAGTVENNCTGLSQYGQFGQSTINVNDGAELKLNNAGQLGWNMFTVLNVNNGGTLTIANTQQLTRQLKLNGGTVKLTGVDVPLETLGNRTITVTEDSSILAEATETAVNPALVVSNGTLTVNVASSKTLTLAAPVVDGASGTGIAQPVSKTGEGTLKLTKANTATGTLTVSAGTLALDGGSWAGTVAVGASGTLDVITSETVADGALLAAGTFTLAEGATVKENGTAVDVAVEADGIHKVAIVTITVPEVANASVVVSDGTTTYTPTTEGGTSYSVPAGSTITVTYTADEGYKLEGTGTFNFSATDGYSVDVSSTKSSAIVARTDDDQTFTRVRDALTYAYMTTGVEVVTVIDSTWSDDGTYDEYFAWDATARTYTKRTYVARIGAVSFTSLAAAIAYEGAVNPIVVLLADVTLTDKLVVSNKTVTITADSAKTITGQLRVVDASNVTIGENVTITSDKHPTVFVLGDPAVKTAGTAPSTLVVNGKVLNTNTGFDKTFAISGNGLDTQGVNITIGVTGEVRNANGIAIYQPAPGSLTVNGTVEGASAISIKDGTLTVNDGAVITATLANGQAYVGNGNGESPTGDAIIAPYYPLSKGYGTPVVSILGGTITVTDTANCTGIEAYDFEGTTAPQDAATNVNVSGGLFNTPVAEVYCASGYIPCEVTGGYSVKTGAYVAQVVGGAKYETIQEAVDQGDVTVKILGDVTLTEKLVVDGGQTVVLTADSAVTVTGQLRVVDGSSCTIGENVTFTSASHPTVFVLGDPAVKTAGTAKSTLVVNGTVLNTNAGFDKTFAIAGNGLDTQGVDVTINGTVRNANGIAIYKAFPGDLVVNGTVEGASAISIKDGTLTVNDNAVITATLANGQAYVGNGNGESPTGDAIIAPYYPLSKGYGTPVVSILGGTITVTDTVNCTGIEAYDFEGTTAPQDAATNVNVSGGLFNTPVAKVYCASGYIPCEVTGGYSVKVPSGIDPTDSTSTQEVTPTAEEIEAAGSAEAAAIAAATVTVPDGVSGVDAETYKTYFTYSATPTETAGTYTVAITGLADEVTETADGNALAALEAATAGGTLSAEVAVKPGLYYGTAAGTDVTTLKASAGTLNTTGTLDLSGVTKPSTGEAFFIKIKVGTTAFTAEE